jgi:predicted glycogen debranching enzyme
MALTVTPALDREWLLTNRRGGSASGTTTGMPTRRYHGLLCVAARPPLERWLLLNAILEKVTVAGEPFELANFEFGDRIHPRGYERLTGVAYDLAPARPWVRFEYRWGGVVVRKTVTLFERRDLVEVRYDVESDGAGEIRVELLPFVSMRDFHALRVGERAMSLATEGRGFVVRGPDDACPALRMEGMALFGRMRQPLAFKPVEDWWTGLVLREEAARGQDSVQDLFTPGWFSATLEGAGAVVVRGQGLTVAEEAASSIPVATAVSAGGNPDAAPSADERLKHAAAQFVVDRRRADGRWSRTILAGYPWFGDWGRDAFIALPGLLLLDEAFDDAREVLCTFASAQMDGLIPNRFSDYGDGCDYNSVDASLWFIIAADRYARASGDDATWRSDLAPACHGVVKAFTAGTRFDIFVDKDGLVSAGNPDTQITWMDAMCDGVVFTPRNGKCVEVNALWYEALSRLAERDPGDARLATLRRRVRANYASVFWNEQRQCLYDCVRPDAQDATIRPNQIFAVSLEQSALTPAQRHAVVACVREHLLTPYGLRSLAPTEPGYRPRYEGDRMQRDGAYHQGTVWAWLMGPYVEAFLRIHEFSADAKAEARRLLAPLVAHLDDAGLGSVSEIFDAEPPHTPRGCYAQAWSVAELRRALAMAS